VKPQWSSLPPNKMAGAKVTVHGAHSTFAPRPTPTGVRVGLGTSGGGSNDAGHLLADARLAMQVSGLVGEPVSARECLGIATEGSAAGLGRDELLEQVRARLGRFFGKRGGAVVDANLAIIAEAYDGLIDITGWVAREALAPTSTEGAVS